MDGSDGDVFVVECPAVGAVVVGSVSLIGTCEPEILSVAGIYAPFPFIHPFTLVHAAHSDAFELLTWRKVHVQAKVWGQSKGENILYDFANVWLECGEVGVWFALAA